jgi:hypothetical protein
MHNTVERLGGGQLLGAAATGICQEVFEPVVHGSVATEAAVSGFQGLMKEVVLALGDVWPEAVCRTCCFEGIIEKPHFSSPGC